jgi:uroporphyrinogen-III synthase
VKRRLAGVRVMLTRPTASNEPLAQILRAEGARVVSVPLIRIMPPTDPASLQAAADTADMADWLVFTSANGVTAFARGRRAPLPARVRIAAVGPATAAAVHAHLHRPVDLIPDRHDAEALAGALLAAARPNASVTIFHPEGASSQLASQLRAAGHAVTSAAAYRTVAAAPADIAKRVASADAIVLASGSAVRSLVSALADCGRSGALNGKILTAIGPATAREARRHGLTGVTNASDTTSQGIADSIAERRSSSAARPK